MKIRSLNWKFCLVFIFARTLLAGDRGLDLSVSQAGGPTAIPNGWFCNAKYKLMVSYRILHSHDKLYKNSSVEEPIPTDHSDEAINKMRVEIFEASFPNVLSRPGQYETRVMAHYALSRGLSGAQMWKKVNEVKPLVEQAVSRGSFYEFHSAYYLATRVLEVSERLHMSPEAVLQQAAALGQAMKTPGAFTTILNLKDTLHVIQLCAKQKIPISKAALRMKKGFEALLKKYGAQYWSPDAVKTPMSFHLAYWYPDFAKAATQIKPENLFNELEKVGEGLKPAPDISVQAALFSLKSELNLSQTQLVEFYNPLTEKLGHLGHDDLTNAFRTHFREGVVLDEIVKQEAQRRAKRAEAIRKQNRQTQDDTAFQMQMQQMNQALGGSDMNIFTPE